MKIGDLAQHYSQPRFWGIIVGVDTNEFELFWMDGYRTWISKISMVKRRGDKWR
jgi:hypothetical protein